MSDHLPYRTIPTGKDNHHNTTFLHGVGSEETIHSFCNSVKVE